MHRILTVIFMVLLAAGIASAGVVTLDDETQTTTFTATVSEQMDVSVTAAVAFSVLNTAIPTVQTGTVTVSATAIALDEGHKLRIDIAPNEADFEESAAGGGPTWPSEAISWDAPVWTGGTGSSGTMSDTADDYHLVAQMTAANSTEVSTALLEFTLAANAAVTHAGDHTLACTWKFSSLAP